jgi:hypothetical protein
MIRIAWSLTLALSLILPACGGATHDMEDPVDWDGDSDESTDEPASLEGLLQSDTPSNAPPDTDAEQDPSDPSGITQHSDPTGPRASESWYSLDPGIPEDGGNPQPWSMDNPTH